MKPNRTRRVPILLTDEEHALFTAVSGKTGEGVGQYMRRVALAEARKEDHAARIARGEQ